MSINSNLDNVERERKREKEREREREREKQKKEAVRYPTPSNAVLK